MESEKIALLSVVLQYDRSTESIAAILNEIFKDWEYGARKDEFVLLRNINKSLSENAKNAMYFFCSGPTA